MKKDQFGLWMLVARKPRQNTRTTIRTKGDNDDRKANRSRFDILSENHRENEGRISDEFNGNRENLEERAVMNKMNDEAKESTVNAIKTKEERKGINRGKGKGVVTGYGLKAKMNILKRTNKQMSFSGAKDNPFSDGFMMGPTISDTSLQSMVFQLVGHGLNKQKNVAVKIPRSKGVLKGNDTLSLMANNKLKGKHEEVFGQRPVIESSTFSCQIDQEGDPLQDDNLHSLSITQVIDGIIQGLNQEVQNEGTEDRDAMDEQGSDVDSA